VWCLIVGQRTEPLELHLPELQWLVVSRSFPLYRPDTICNLTLLWWFPSKHHTKSPFAVTADLDSWSHCTHLASCSWDSIFATYRSASWRDLETQLQTRLHNLQKRLAFQLMSSATIKWCTCHVYSLYNSSPAPNGMWPASNVLRASLCRWVGMRIPLHSDCVLTYLDWNFSHKTYFHLLSRKVLVLVLVLLPGKCQLPNQLHVIDIAAGNDQPCRPIDHIHEQHSHQITTSLPLHCTCLNHYFTQRPWTAYSHSTARLQDHISHSPSDTLSLLCRMFQKERYNFESLYKFIQGTCALFWTVIM
jgi:hypothetical protein